MAILDKKLVMMDALSIVAQTAVSVASDTLDLGTATDCWDQSITPDIGEGGDIWFNCRVATTFTISGTTAPTLYGTISLYTHTAVAASAGTTLLTKGILNANTVAGATIVRQKIPGGTISRYLRAYCEPGGTSITAGALDMWISLDSESEVPTT